jgi:putative transcriptional regulator
MKSSLKEQFARLGPIRELNRVQSGSPAVLALRPGQVLAEVKTITAAISLARRGVSLLKAKRAIEEMLSRGRAVVLLPMVEDASILARELAGSGVRSSMVASEEVDVKSVRERLGLTQEQFALRYGLDLDSLQNWETKRRKPEAAVRSYLRVIEHMPETASEALETPVPMP